MSTPGPYFWSKPSAALNYGIAILTVAAAVSAGLTLGALLQTSPIVSLFLCGIMFVAWFGGTGPAALAAALSILAFVYFFVSPANTFLMEVKDIPRVALFAVAALSVVALSAAQRRATESFRRARDDLQNVVRELETLNEALRIESAERKQAEERIRLTEQRLQVTIDTIPALVATYEADGARGFVNKTGRDFTGITPDDLKSGRWRTSVHPDDHDMAESKWRACIASGEPFQLEYRIRRGDGEYRWHMARRVPLRDESGAVIRWYGVGFDIEEQKRAEESARQSQAQLARARRELQLMIDMIPALVTVFRADGEREFVNKTWRDYTGVGLRDIQDGGWTTVVHPDDHASSEALWRHSIATGEPLQIEHRVRRADGQFRWHMGRRVPLRDEAGNIVRWYGVGADIEDQKRAEEALRDSEARLAQAKRELELIIDTIPAYVTVFGPDGEREFVNKTWRDNTGLQLADIQHGNWRIIVHPDDQERSERVWREAIAARRPLLIEQRIRRHDGVYRWHRGHRVPLRDDTGTIIRWYSVATDIEDHKVAEAALRQREAELAEAKRELQATIDTIPALITSYWPNGLRDFANQAWERFTGVAQEKVRGTDWMIPLHSDEVAHSESAWRACLATGEPFERDQQFRRADGEYRWHSVRRVPLRNEAGEIIKWYSVGYDIEGQKRAEAALQQREAELAEAKRELQLTIDTIPTLVASYRGDGTPEFFNQTARDYVGPDVSIERLFESIHPDDFARVQDDWRAHLESGEPFQTEQRLRRADGQYRLHLVRRVPLHDANGNLVKWYASAHDIDDQRRAEEALHAAQTELTHASRVATLGEMSASIAHEVNQPLAAIIANGEACLRWLNRSTPNLIEVRNGVEWMIKDGNRASDVIRRIRALSNKSDMQKALLNVNDAVHEALALLQRELVNRRVSLRTELASSLPVVLADRVQLQQVMINLIMNAIEAMDTVTDRPRHLEIRSHEDETHQVVVAVQDCGTGISAECADHLFEAFYSTKSGGLGIGLSICRSIIEAHDGRITASSNAGPGATLEFALPSRREHVSQAARQGETV